MLFGGLFAGILGIFPIGKKSEYLLEFDNTKETNIPQESTPATDSAPAPTETETKPANSETPKEAKAKISAAKKAEKIAAAEAKKEAKAAKKAKTQQSTAPQEAPQLPITNGTTSQKPEEVVLFAPNFLMPKPTAKRRRPGPNMSMFRGMAKSMNLPR